MTEATTLTLKHVAEGLERAVGGASDSAAVTSVVKEGIHRLLEHALFVADDDFWSLELQQRAKTIVAIDDSAIEVIEIGCREASTFERNERAEIRWNDWKHIQDHPLGACFRSGKALNEFKAFCEFFAELFTPGRAHGLLDFLLDDS